MKTIKRLVESLSQYIGTSRFLLQDVHNFILHERTIKTGESLLMSGGTQSNYPTLQTILEHCLRKFLYLEKTIVTTLEILRLQTTFELFRPNYLNHRYPDCRSNPQKYSALYEQSRGIFSRISMAD